MRRYKLYGYASQGTQIQSEDIKACLLGGLQLWFRNDTASLTSKSQKHAPVSRLANDLSCKTEFLNLTSVKKLHGKNYLDESSSHNGSLYLFVQRQVFTLKCRLNFKNVF